MRKNWALVVEDQDVKLEAVDPALIAESPDFINIVDGAFPYASDYKSMVQYSG